MIDICFQKTHFATLMNLSGADKDKLENLLDRCYQYVAAVPYTGENADSQENNLFSDSAPKPKLYKPPQHRPEGRVNLAEKVRYEVAKLMKALDYDDDEDEISLGPRTKKKLVTITPAGLKLWQERLLPGPSVDDFVLQLHGGIYTAWNKAAADVFCRHFCSEQDYRDYRRQDVRKAFMRRITQLKRDFENQSQEEKSIERLDDERRARRLGRRGTV